MPTKTMDIIVAKGTDANGQEVVVHEADGKYIVRFAIDDTQERVADNMDILKQAGFKLEPVEKKNAKKIAAEVIAKSHATAKAKAKLAKDEAKAKAKMEKAEAKKSKPTRKTKKPARKTKAYKKGW